MHAEVLQSRRADNWMGKKLLGGSGSEGSGECTVLFLEAREKWSTMGSPQELALFIICISYMEQATLSMLLFDPRVEAGGPSHMLESCHSEGPRQAGGID